jgi:cellulose biosynthesis protein BcsQ
MGEIIAIANPKGGPGKTTLTQLISTYISEEKVIDNSELLVIDTDRQRSYSKERKAEINTMGLTEEDAERIFQIIHIPLKQIPTIINSLRSEYKLILIDTPGNSHDEGYYETLKEVDKILIPFRVTRKDIRETHEFNRDLKNHKIQALKFGVPNQVTGNKKEWTEIKGNPDIIPFNFSLNFIRNSEAIYDRKISTIKRCTNNQGALVDTELLIELTEFIVPKELQKLGWSVEIQIQNK